ncbi:Protease synthase and sporulation protein PAI 2 [Halomonadaceae bacterium LMG 33818]|uniref:FMN-binding negative transcriptional regulator n=1 Tax=Cernens ardua TaxID=3402176 RepID=UPI003EDC9D1E
MYLPRLFTEQNESSLLDVIRHYPFATLIVALADANNVPYLVDHLPLIPSFDTGHAKEITCLQGHLARHNPLVKEFTSAQGEEGSTLQATAIFHGEQTYVSPRWYPSKAHGKEAVPTWNYQVVHVHGMLSLEDDSAWLQHHVTELSHPFEQQIENGQPWKMSDLSTEFLSGMLRGIVGVNLTVTSIEAKTKASQNRSLEDRNGVREGMKQEGLDSRIIKALVKEPEDKHA